jgi:hypothetical protein
MAAKEPVKYEAGLHTPFVGPDTLPVNRIPLSADPGNLIEPRTDGLFYGLTAPPSTAQLFVSSSSGNDANLGTKASPLETIAEAISRSENRPVTYQIVLRCGETHHVDAMAPDRSAAQVEFWWYDDPIYGDFNTAAAGCISYTPTIADDLTRPILMFHRIETTTHETAGFMYEQVNYNGINLKFVDDVPGSILPDGPDAINRVTRFRSETRFIGCVIDMPSYAGPIFRQCDVFYLNTIINGDTDDRYYILNEIISTSYANGTNHAACGSRPAYTATVSNIATAIVLASFFDLRYDAPSQQSFNAAIGWDIFP